MMPTPLSIRLSGALVILLLLSACGVVQTEPAWKKAVAGDGPGNPALLETTPLVVSNLPKSRSGNRSEYEVFGVRYRVLESARDFREQGIASWYGSKFHGNATASGEIYDMHQLTAAHKHLPLPTFVRVTRQDNGKSIVVKVNDRGPFVGDRIIDLSYGAAAALDMLGSGKAAVSIEALSHDVDESQAETSAKVHVEPPAEPLAESLVTTQRTFSSGSPSVESTDANGSAKHYVQVGAFSEQANAQRLMQEVLEGTSLPSRLDFEPQLKLYQVVVGPFYDDSVVKNALQLLGSHGIEGYRSPSPFGS